MSAAGRRGLDVRKLTVLIQNPGAAIYGTITVGALLAAESPRRETYARTVAATVIALVLYWLAHAYAGLLGRRLESREALSPERLVSTMLHELPMLGGAALPLVTLLICWAIGASLSGAVLAAVWTSASIVVAIELAAGWRARLSGSQLVLHVAAGAVLGVLVIALRVVLH